MTQAVTRTLKVIVLREDGKKDESGIEAYTFTAKRFTFPSTRRRRIAYGYVYVNGHAGMGSKSGSGSLSGLDSASDPDSDFDLEWTR